MASLNKVMIIGNLGRDPEVSYTPSGMAVTKFTLATKEFWSDRATGEKKEKTEWHRIVTFAKLAETCGRYLTKGKQVYVEGKLQTTSYEKDGITRYSTDIIANTIQFLGTRGDSSSASQGGYGQNSGYQDGGSYGQGNGNFQNSSQQKNDAQDPTSFDGVPGFQTPPDDDIPF